MTDALTIRDYLTSCNYLFLRRKYGHWCTEIQPDEVIYPYRAKEWPKYVKRWPLFACPGDWDLTERRQNPFRLQQFKDLFVTQIPYQETSLYADMLTQLKKQGVTEAPKLRSLKEIDDYFAGVYTLYESMKKEGYQKRPTLDASSKGEKEITIRIGRQGELMKTGEGTHRLALARLLGLKSVFAVVDVVHPEWIKKSKEKYGGSTTQAIEKALASLHGRSDDM